MKNNVHPDAQIDSAQVASIVDRLLLLRNLHDILGNALMVFIHDEYAAAALTDYMDVYDRAACLLPKLEYHQLHQWNRIFVDLQQRSTDVAKLLRAGRIETIAR
ncbi:hypothetical protein [Vogesella sp. AC12]|uniref:hypothetical protein n=1 Tax=Vogesella sp. AC12 TaxID=2950550 RepID=UPI002109046B|nr:hypothetical protein [Vogesella sp. AC12]MCQ4145808.1 hypothetical protein [Vogesella sp. AC12]